MLPAHRSPLTAMFTGIIETTGTVLKNGKDRIEIKAPSISRQLKKGSSIAVDGVCLTVISKSSTAFVADVMPETYKKTTLGSKKPGDLINLELALSSKDRMEGHYVSGHVEGVGELKKITPDKDSTLLTFKIPERLTRYIVPKGSIAINGISLTVIGMTKNTTTVGIIPHTWESTNLRTLRLDDKVNVETDLVGKYIEKFVLGSK